MREPFKEFIESELGTETVLIACGLPASYKTETTEVVARLKEYQIFKAQFKTIKELCQEIIIILINYSLKSI